MKLKTIKIEGMHNVKNKIYDISGFRYFYGPNGAGKSTVLQAVQLALLGYIPGTDKTKSAIFKHSNGVNLSVVLTIDDNGNEILISRNWEKTGKEITTSSEITPATYDIKEIVGNLELPVFNFNEFAGMSANKLKDWFIDFLPPVETDFDWETELKDSIVDFGVILDHDFIEDTIKYVNDLSENLSGIALVREFNAYLKEQLSAFKAAKSRLQSTVQSLIYYNDCDDSQSIEDLKQKITQEQARLDELNECLTKIKQNERLFDRLKSVKVSIKSDSIENDPGYIELTAEIKTMEDKLSALEEERSAIEKEITDLSIDYREKKKILESDGKCPYTSNQCQSIKSIIPEITDKMEKIKSDIQNKTEELTKSETEIKNLNIEINAKISDRIEKENTYRQYEILSEQINKDVPDMPHETIENEISELKECIEKERDLLVKLEANRKYEELTDEINNEKYKTEQDIEILKVWCNLTDVNGMQSKLMKAPFNKLSEKISYYICRFYENDEKFRGASFNLTEKQNSFSFGVIDENGVYIEYDLLSSGEKCLFTLAMLLSIVELSDSPLKLIMVDDLLDHLDPKRINRCFETLYSVDNIQILLAGVEPCIHLKSNEFVIPIQKQ